MHDANRASDGKGGCGIRLLVPSVASLALFAGAAAMLGRRVLLARLGVVLVAGSCLGDSSAGGRMGTTGHICRLKLAAWLVAASGQ